jgi:hypothetical protein
VEQAAPRCAATGGCSAFPFARSRSASPAELLLVKKSSLVVMFYFFFILRSSCTLSQEKKNCANRPSDGCSLADEAGEPKRARSSAACGL